MPSFTNGFLVLMFIGLVGVRFTASADELPQPPLIIGLDADMSAVSAQGGEAIRRGAELAIAQINAQGGVLGRPLALEIKDHRGNPARGVANITEYAEDPNVIAVLGGVHTPVALAELQAIHQHNLLYLGAWAAGTKVVNNGFIPNNVFRVSVSDREASHTLLTAAKNRGLTRLALVLERTAWGRSNLHSLTAAAKVEGVDIVSVRWVNWGQTDVAADIQAISLADAQAIILVTNAPEAAVVAKTLLNTSFTPIPIISHWGIAGGDFIEQLGLENSHQLDISVIQTFSFLYQRNNTAANLLTRYVQAYGECDPASIPAVVGVAHAYDLVHLLALAIRQANSFDTQQIRQALESLPTLEGAVKTYSAPFSEHQHDALLAEDYFMTTFNSRGYLEPITTK